MKFSSQFNYLSFRLDRNLSVDAFCSKGCWTSRLDKNKCILHKVNEKERRH